MSLLLVSSNYYPNVGGVETHLRELVDYVKSNGIRTYVLTLHPKSTSRILSMGDVPETKCFESDGVLEIRRVNLFSIPLVFPTVSVFLTLAFYLPFFLLRHRDVRVLHAHCSPSLAACILVGRLLFGRSVFYTQHSPLEFHGTYRSRILRWCLRRCEAIFSISQRIKSDIVSYGVSEDKVVLFRYWVDLNRFRPVENAKKKLGLDDKFVVLFSGRFFEYKGVRVFAEACQLLKDEGNYFFIALGSGPLESYLNERVSLVRKVLYDELPLYYSAADLFVIPSTYVEGFGKVIIEALACGTPVVGSNAGAIPEAFDSSVGVLVEPGNVQQLSDTVRHYHDSPEALYKLKQNARPYAEKQYSELNARVIVDRYRLD